MHRNFYGFTIIVLGAWEAAAFRGLLPKITTVTRKRRLHKAIMVLYLIGAAKHLCEAEK